MLNESQLLILNNLIYDSGFCNPANNGKTIGDILNTMDISSVNPPEKRAVLEAALKDPDICGAKIDNINYEAETESRMACVIDKNGQAYAVFAGTGKNEWGDNTEGGILSDTEQQIKAKNWVENLGYDNIIATGHSKGGNKAMYVAVTSDKVKEAYAFDGQGFSKEFCEKYRDQIAQMRSKIHLYAHSRDYVNILLSCIAGDVHFITNVQGVDGAVDYHQPYVLFGFENGTINGLGAEGKQDPLMEMFHKFVEYTMYNANPAEWKLTLNVLGELMTKYVAGEGGVVRQDIIDMFGMEAIEVILRYLAKYLNELRINDSQTYAKYRNAFGHFAKDAVGGDNFISFLVNNTISSEVFDELLFDNLANGKILRIYIHAERFLGGNVRGRDFSEETRVMMLSAARETEEEPWWRIDRWDCWYRIEQLRGGLTWDNYTGRIDEYYRKLIDINEASVKDIERIFREVNAQDAYYSAKMMNHTGTLHRTVTSKLAKIASSIKPGV